MKLTNCICGAKAKMSKKVIPGTNVKYYYVYCSEDCSEPTFATRLPIFCNELWEASQRKKRGITTLVKETIE